MKNSASDLFLLTTSLSQLKDRDRIVSLFIESLNTIFPDHAFQWAECGSPRQANQIEVCTRNDIYGLILYSGQTDPEDVTWPLIHNAAQMLGVILEKLKQEQLLIGHNKHLESYAQERSQEASSFEQRYRELFESSRDGLVLLNPERRFIDCNQAYCSMVGYSMDELKQMTNARNITPAKWWQWEQEEIWNKRLLKKQFSGLFEKEYIRKDGSIFPVEIAAHAMLDEQGKLKYIWGIVRDITERKRAEAAIEKRIVALTRPMDDCGIITFDDLFNLNDIQQLQDEFAKATGVASIITRPDGTPITVPSNFCRLCIDIIRKTEMGCANCYKSDAILGRHHPEGPIIQPCMSGGLWDAGAGITVGGQHIANWLIGQVRDETQTEEKMAEYAREIGVDEQTFLTAFREVPAMSHKQFEQVAKALFLLANQLSNIAYQNVQQARFITERKDAEDQVRRLNAELEDRVRQRTLQLQAANKELEAFAYSVSHDLRAPLRGIDGFSKALLEDYADKLDDMGKNYLDRIRAATQRMGRLIDDLLNLSRLIRADMSHKTVNLSDMAHAIAEELQSTDPQRAINWAIADNIRVEGDPTLLRSVMENLLGNAWKFTCHKNPAQIEFGTELQNGSTVHYIKDNGVGFDMAYADKLFGVFQRLHTTAEYPGNGVGLASTKRVIERHGGRIWVSAKVDQGAVFYFTLPGEKSKTDNPISETGYREVYP